MSYENLLNEFLEEHRKEEVQGEVSGFDRVEILTLRLFVDWLKKHEGCER